MALDVVTVIFVVAFSFIQMREADPEIMIEDRAAAATLLQSVIAAAIIVAVWLALLAGVGWWVWQRLSHYLT